MKLLAIKFFGPESKTLIVYGMDYWGL